ncbi:IS3 family transposase [Herbaspirillum seropedicae]|uniref:IS3 family transposase n=1 Tax=Herbaspirillum seropedicae TaxID=964 RepID=UPI0018D470B3
MQYQLPGCASPGKWSPVVAGTLASPAFERPSEVGGLGDGIYGSPRVVRDLIDAGFACSENRVARSMKAAGIKARHKRRCTQEQRPMAAPSNAPNLLDGNLQQLRKFAS